MIDERFRDASYFRSVAHVATLYMVRYRPPGNTRWYHDQAFRTRKDAEAYIAQKMFGVFSEIHVGEHVVAGDFDIVIYHANTPQGEHSHEEET